jgi:hypothetical protein
VIESGVFLHYSQPFFVPIIRPLPDFEFQMLTPIAFGMPIANAGLDTVEPLFAADFAIPLVMHAFFALDDQ